MDLHFDSGWIDCSGVVEAFARPEYFPIGADLGAVGVSPSPVGAVLAACPVLTGREDEKTFYRTSYRLAL